MAEIDEKEIEKVSGGRSEDGNFRYSHVNPEDPICDLFRPGLQMLTDEPNAVLPDPNTCGACMWYSNYICGNTMK